MQFQSFKGILNLILNFIGNNKDSANTILKKENNVGALILPDIRFMTYKNEIARTVW